MNADSNLSTNRMNQLSKVFSIHNYVVLWLLAFLLLFASFVVLLIPFPQYTRGIVSYFPEEVDVDIGAAQAHILVPNDPESSWSIGDILKVRPIKSESTAFQVARIISVSSLSDTKFTEKDAVFNNWMQDWTLIVLMGEQVLREYIPALPVQLEIGTVRLVDLLLA